MAPLIVITGPTASGKTGLAIELAEKYDGEIICADSRTIYRYMDVGTAKPTASERARVLHHMLDVRDPGENYNAKIFQHDANRVIADIRARGKIPFLVGGTGLYIDAVSLEYQWPETQKDDAYKATIETLSSDELQKLIKQQHLTLPENDMNRRHLISVLMRQDTKGTRLDIPRPETYVVAIATDKKQITERIRLRAQQMFADGVIDETRLLIERYGIDSEAMSSNIYPLTSQVIAGGMSKSEAVERFVAKDVQLVKRQLTWLRRHDYIVWGTLDETRAYVEQILSSYYASIERV